MKTVLFEIASNDGYFFKISRITHSMLGIEPTSSTRMLKKKGLDTIVDFFTEKLAKKLLGQQIQADLIVGITF